MTSRSYIRSCTNASSLAWCSSVFTLPIAFWWEFGTEDDGEQPSTNIGRAFGEHPVGGNNMFYCVVALLWIQRDWAGDRPQGTVDPGRRAKRERYQAG